MKRMLFLFFIALAHAEEDPVSSCETNMEIPNGCYIQAVAFEDSLKSFDTKASAQAAAALSQNSDRWVRVLVVGFMNEDRVRYHAVCVFEYKGILWVYDPSFGTYRLTPSPGIRKDPMTLATLWKPSLQVVSASFIEQEKT